MKLFEKKFYLNKRKDIFLTIYLSYQNEKLNIISKFFNKKESFILFEGEKKKNTYDYSSQNFIESLIFEKTYFSKINVKKNSENFCISYKTFNNLKLRKTRINDHFKFLQRNFQMIKKTMNLIINFVIFNHFNYFDNYEKSSLKKRIYFNLINSHLQDSKIINSVLWEKIEVFEQIGFGKVFHFIPHDYI